MQTSNPITNPEIRGRLAPSPTGALHLGNARSFLIAWLSIRARGGTVVMRMEDLDHPKVKPETREEAYADLRWLGLDWDEGPDVGGPHAPYVQSERLDHYTAALCRLQEKGLVYPCTCSRKDVAAAQSAPHSEDRSPVYPGTCRGRYPSYEDAAAELEDGRLPAWRFRVRPGTKVSFTDGYHGMQVADLAQMDGDFVFARHPNGAGYQLVVVVDDHEMKISEVLRGDDLLDSTHRQVLLYQTLGLTPPEFVHVPLVVGPDGRRLAKRHGDTRISAIRTAGTSSEKVVGLLAHWCGWAEFGEELTPRQLIERYNLKAIPKAPAVVADEHLHYLGLR